MEDAQNKGTLNAKFQPELSQNQRLESEKNADSKICPCDIHVNPSGLRKSKYSPPPPLIMDAEEQQKTTIHTRQSK
jgi:hypothetical protein